MLLLLDEANCEKKEKEELRTKKHHDHKRRFVSIGDGQALARARHDEE